MGTSTAAGEVNHAQAEYVVTEPECFAAWPADTGPFGYSPDKRAWHAGGLCRLHEALNAGQRAALPLLHPMWLTGHR